MLRECLRAMMQSSASHSSGVNPFFSRNSLVVLNALSSVDVASPKDGEAGRAAVMEKLAASVPLMRRVLTSFVDPLISRATGRGVTVCAEAIEPTNAIRKRVPSALETMRANVAEGRLKLRTFMSKSGVPGKEASLPRLRARRRAVELRTWPGPAGQNCHRQVSKNPGLGSTSLAPRLFSQ